MRNEQSRSPEYGGQSDKRFCVYGLNHGTSTQCRSSVVDRNFPAERRVLCCVLSAGKLTNFQRRFSSRQQFSKDDSLPRQIEDSQSLAHGVAGWKVTIRHLQSERFEFRV